MASDLQDDIRRDKLQEAEIFEDLTANLAAMVERLLRKHGKNIIGKQFATRRLADVMINMFVLACVLSRVTSSIAERGTEKVAHEIEIARVFAGQVKGAQHQVPGRERRLKPA